MNTFNEEANEFIASFEGGIKGDKGDKGDKGETGARGAKGDKGDTGETGATGATGATVVRQEYYDTDAQGGYIYKQTFDNGSIQYFTAPKGAQGNQGEQGNKGDPGTMGTTFTPSVSSSGVISWTNDGGKSNPQSVNIKGEQGDKGDKGDKGDTGAKGDQGEKGDRGDCNFATFEINPLTGILEAHYTTIPSDITFNLNSNGYLEVQIA